MQTNLYGTPPTPPAFAESRPVTPFCQLQEPARAGVCRALGISLPRALFCALQAGFRDIEHRDPTLGELRLLDTLHRLTLRSPSRLAICELDTDSAELAETWAELMARRRLLADGVSPPCTLADIPVATAAYLRRLGERPAAAPWRVLATADAPGDMTPGCLAVAARAAGYQPVALVTEGGISRLFARYAPQRYTVSERRSAPSAGDLILLVQGLSDATAEALSRRYTLPRSGRVLPRLVPLSGRPLPLALCDLTDGAEIRVESLFPDRTGDIMTEVTGFGALGLRDAYLLRVRRDELGMVQQLCATATPVPGLTVIGQTVGAPRLTFLHMGVVLASLSLSVLRLALAPGLYRVRLDETSPAEPLPTPPVSLDSPAPGLRTASLTCTLDSAGSAYLQSRAAVAAAVAALRELPGPVTLSVALDGYPADGDQDLALPLAALCGLYRASAELRLASPDPCLRPAQAPAEPCRLSVCAFAEETPGVELPC